MFYTKITKTMPKEVIINRIILM